jgi:hypothetical protein
MEVGSRPRGLPFTAKILLSEKHLLDKHPATLPQFQNYTFKLNTTYLFTTPCLSHTIAATTKHTKNTFF